MRRLISTAIKVGQVVPLFRKGGRIPLTLSGSWLRLHQRGGKSVPTLITLLLIAGQATAGEQLIDVQHDSVRGVTCWIIAGTGISCLPDSSLLQASASTAADESQAARAYLATYMCQNEQLGTTPLPQQTGFQL
ncbi:hypothetical protein A7J50_1169 [Pseudomonas antarctica]|uniref:Uncharacterized protein n=1 Tax=Pseudomonas antarctica TaxID=219572 RepID=A0A172YX18_9PSED|nr:hypothetical protein [Pseudomonas antarctica]ANF84608.1 hypothetical protein A7J50_1169 [Pseudomonas antarctica]